MPSGHVHITLHSYIILLLLTSYLHYLPLLSLRDPSRFLGTSIRAFGSPLVRYCCMYLGQTQHRSSSTSSRELSETGMTDAEIAGASVAAVVAVVDEAIEDADVR